MTARVGAMSVDRTPISQADLARIQAEEKWHADQQRRAIRVVAGTAHGADDCRMLLSILGLDRGEIVSAARAELAARPAAKRVRKRRAA